MKEPQHHPATEPCFGVGVGPALRSGLNTLQTSPNNVNTSRMSSVRIQKIEKSYNITRTLLTLPPLTSPIPLTKKQLIDPPATKLPFHANDCVVLLLVLFGVPRHLPTRPTTPARLLMNPPGLGWDEGHCGGCGRFGAWPVHRATQLYQHPQKHRFSGVK